MVNGRLLSRGIPSLRGRLAPGRPIDQIEVPRHLAPVWTLTDGSATGAATSCAKHFRDGFPDCVTLCGCGIAREQLQTAENLAPAPLPTGQCHYECRRISGSRKHPGTESALTHEILQRVAVEKQRRELERLLLPHRLHTRCCSA